MQSASESKEMIVGLGKHCSYSTCKQLDFLPYVCDFCSHTYCLEHRSERSHECVGCRPQAVTVECPQCQRILPVQSSSSVLAADEVIARHMQEGCQPLQRIKNSCCSLPKCKSRSLVPFTCADCHNNFCLKHRHASDHKCQQQHRKAAAAVAHIGPFRIDACKTVVRSPNSNTNLSHSRLLHPTIEASDRRNSPIN
eukprot:TRINITY_DN765_c0_g1_i2.p1 TRINITY_DN765_c0_g1~~TRINITY_DN765_c0_g1_i2.p1  ORF type:complete len:196 (-),score=2.44 TRINITY_DN765_c0_g1_i2:206-793(-)